MNEGVPVGGISNGGVVGRSIFACDTSQLGLRLLGKARAEAERAKERSALASIFERRTKIQPSLELIFPLAMCFYTTVRGYRSVRWVG